MPPLGITGLVAAPHTPFTPDGELLLSSIEKQAALLIEGGVSAAFVCGTTGEGLSLTSAERMQQVERWVDAAPPSLPVIVHIGHTSAREARALAAHAQSAGAAACSALAPFFFKPAGVAELLDFSAYVAAGAPALPFYFYHLPSMTGVCPSIIEYLQAARDRIPNFAGIKYTHNDLMEFQQCLALAGPDLDVLFGRDEILLAALTAGARGAIGSTYNFAAPLYRRLITAFSNGDLPTARALQAEAVQIVEIMRRYGEIAVGKAIMTLSGVPCGPVRAPLTNLTPERMHALRHDLEGLHVFTRTLS